MSRVVDGLKVPGIDDLLIIAAVPAAWPKDAISRYQSALLEISWEGTKDAIIISEPTAVLQGRLKALTVEQRMACGVYLQEGVYIGVFDVGDATSVCYVEHHHYWSLLTREERAIGNNRRI